MGLWKIVDKYAKLAGLETHVHPHMFRHSFATHLMNNGVDLVIIQALLGHSNVKTTSIYLHVKDYQTLNIISPLDTWD